MSTSIWNFYIFLFLSSYFFLTWWRKVTFEKIIFYWNQFKRIQKRFEWVTLEWEVRMLHFRVAGHHRWSLRTGTLPVPLRNLPQSQCFALALVGGHILQWRRQEIFRYFKIARILVNSGIVQNFYNFSIEHYSHILILSKF